MNTSEQPRRYVVSATGLDGLQVASDTGFEVSGATTQSVLVRLQASPEALKPGSNKITISVAAVDDAALKVDEKAVFLGLGR
jgi:hypothetical protein